MQFLNHRVTLLAFLVCCLPWFSIINSKAQERNMHFNNLSVEDGLSQSVINCVVQDKYGFLWIGTDDGLNRYDGYEFQVFKSNYSDTNSISGNKVLCLANGPGGNLWIGTNKGLSLFDQVKKKFRRLHLGIAPGKTKPEISTLFFDQVSNLWIGTWENGLYSYNFSEQQLEKISLKDKSNHDVNTIRSITALQNVFYIGTGQGLFTLEKNTSLVHLGDTAIAVNSLGVLSNIVWAGTKKGLFMIKNGESERIDLGDGEKPKNIRDLIVFENELWLATFDGLVHYQPSTGTSRLFTSSPDYPYSLSNNRLTSLYVDNAQVLWVGTWGGGLDYHDHQQKAFLNLQSMYHLDPFKSDVGYGLAKDSRGNIWVATFGDGIIKCDIQRKQYVQIDEVYPAIEGRRFTDIVIDKNDNAWVGSDGKGLYLINEQNGITENYRNEKILGDQVMDLLLDNQDNLWVGTLEGVTMISREKGIFNQFPFNKSGDGQELSNTSLCLDNDGNVWVARNNVLYIADPIEKQLKRQDVAGESTGQYSESQVFEIRPDSRGNIWICTDGNGVFRFNTRTNSLDNLNEQDGLPNNVVYTIIEDDNNNYWLSTNKGLSMYNPRSNTFKNYDKSDCIRSNEFNWKSFYKDPGSGYLYFGGIGGVTIFHPDSIKDSPIVPTVRFTRFKVNHEPVVIGEKYNDIEVLSSNINECETIYLSYKDYAMTFEFSALHFANPGKIKYKYLMEGIDEGWITAEAKERSVTYINIPPGDYTFYVKATNQDGVWNDTPTKIDIEIEPPFWQSLWFRIVAGINIFLLVILFVIARTRQLMKQKQQLAKIVANRTKELVTKNQQIEQQKNELEEHRSHLEKMIKSRTKDLRIAKEKAEESDQLKTAFLESISHEIRTPMNAMYGFSQLLDDKNLTSVKRVKYIDAILNSTNLLLGIFTDLVDISKIHSNQLKLIPVSFNLNFLLEKLHEELRVTMQDAGKTNVELKLTKGLTDKESEVVTDPARVSQIINKLVHNSIKFTNDGFIEFGYSVINNKIQFIVRDTGQGISKEKQELIFDYFNKEDFTSEARKYGGVGLGLSIARGLVNLMQGEIRLQSQKGIGTTFFVELPYKPSEDHDETDLLGINEINDRNLWEGKSILIVEDEEYNFIYLKEILQGSGAVIVHSKSGKNAIELCQAKHFDLILMDIKLPGLSGLEATSQIRRFNPTVPIIAQTAHAMHLDREQSLKAGCNDYIAKPYTKKEIIQLVQKYL